MLGNYLVVSLWCLVTVYLFNYIGGKCVTTYYEFPTKSPAMKEGEPATPSCYRASRLQRLTDGVLQQVYGEQQYLHSLQLCTKSTSFPTHKTHGKCSRFRKVSNISSEPVLITAAAEDSRSSWPWRGIDLCGSACATPHHRHLLNRNLVTLNNNEK